MDFFGLDIGSHYLKAVELKQAGDKYDLRAAGTTASTGKGVFSDAENDLTVLAQKIKKLIDELKIGTKNVAVALPEDQVFTRLISLPKLSSQELESALNWEAEQYVPLPLSEITLSHQIVGQTSLQGKEKLEVLLVASPNRLIDKTVQILRSSGLNPISLETEILSMSRSLVGASKETTLLVDLGAKASDLAIVENSQVIFTRSIATAGEALTRAISTGLGLETSRSEEYKKAYGANPERLEGKVLKAIEPVLEAIAKEISAAIQFYVSQKEQRVVKRILLTGGSAMVPNLTYWMTKKVGLEVQIGNPFIQVNQSELLGKLSKETYCFYSVAAGLAMKEA